MRLVWHIFGWTCAIFFGLLTISMLLLHNWVGMLLLLLITLICLPPLTSLAEKKIRQSIHPILKPVLVAGLLVILVFQMIGRDASSIYKSPEVEKRLMAIYNEKMETWPVPYQDVFLETEYGTVHVIVSGSESAPPVLMLHASGVSSWSWKYNAAPLSEKYRLYAVDLIGDAGKSRYNSLKNMMRNGRDQAHLYRQITTLLGLEKVRVVGASEGGFIASNFAMYEPDRVEKLVLLAPMGYAGSLQSIIRITIAQLFPLKAIHDLTFSWAFSDDSRLKSEYSEWFPLVMRGLIPAKVAPLPFQAEERELIRVPVLFVFGKRDNLVGDPENAKRLVQNMPAVRVEIVDAGHLMAAEKPDIVDRLIIDFFGPDSITGVDI
jgi:pimeloyl-ACP methyl ester carboxylesterase